MKLKVLIIPIAIVLIAVFSAAYIVDETEQVVITQFGKAIGDAKTEPGLYFKVPMIQQANYFPKICSNGTVTRVRFPLWTRRSYMWTPLPAGR